MAEPVSNCRTYSRWPETPTPPLAPAWVKLPREKLQPPLHRGGTSPWDTLSHCPPAPKSRLSLARGRGVHLPPSATPALMRTIIPCSVAFLGVTNWLILGRPFEDGKQGITHGLEGRHLPQSGPESAERPPTCRQTGRAGPSPCSRSGLAKGRGVASTPPWPVPCGPGVWEPCVMGVCVVE